MSKEGEVVRYTWEPSQSSQLTSQQETELAALAEMKDEDIDFSDLPELTDEQLARMVRANPNYRPTKASTTLRLDSDILNWLRQSGKGWQSRINEILRREMLKADSARS